MRCALLLAVAGCHVPPLDSTLRALVEMTRSGWVSARDTAAELADLSRRNGRDLMKWKHGGGNALNFGAVIRAREMPSEEVVLLIRPTILTVGGHGPARALLFSPQGWILDQVDVWCDTRMNEMTAEFLPSDSPDKACVALRTPDGVFPHEVRLWQGGWETVRKTFCRLAIRDGRFHVIDVPAGGG